MNRIDRLFAITLQLQSKKRLRAQDLARHFEVSERTIYRDMQALSESGVPVVALPGEGYELLEGFYLPPLILTAQEAGALFLGAQLLTAQASVLDPFGNILGIMYNAHYLAVLSSMGK